MKHSRPRHAARPHASSSPTHADALRIHEVRQTHMGGLRPERIASVPPGVSLPLATWRVLVVAVDAQLHAREVLARFVGDRFILVTPAGEVCELELLDLAARCHGASVDTIRTLAEAQVQALLGDCQPMEPEALPTFEVAAPRILAQVFRDEVIADKREHLIARPLCEGLVSVLSIDLEFGIGSLTREITRAWGRSDESLMRLGVENLRRRKVERTSLRELGLPGFLLFADDIALCAQVQVLSSHLGRHHPAGALVAMPSRHTLLCIPLEQGDLKKTAQRFADAVVMSGVLFKELARISAGEAAFSDAVYWWRDGALRAVPAQRTATGAFVMPPTDCVDLLLARAPIDAN